MSQNDTKPEVVMYTQALCGYCSAARALLQQKGIEYSEIDVTMDAGLRRKMTERTGRNTVPQIFIGEQHIGGYDDMASLDQNNKLDALLGIRP
ncbi:MAG: glutaredoxin 3 [Gammaproteobacteria bacterium]|nr:glutaredoxin 3 [Gammaproteobacteria bacterium]